MFRWVLASVVGLSLVLGYFLTLDRENEPKNIDRVLNRGLIGEPETLDFLNYRTVQAGKVLRDIGEGLVAYSHDGRLIGGVAESWDISSDGLTYSFRLRPDAQWSNGQPVRADDFANSFRRLVTPSAATANAYKMEQIYMAPQILRGEASPDELGVFAANDFELTIKLHSPTPYFLQLLTHASTFPTYSRPRSNNSSSDPTEYQTISNGAYVIDEWIVGSELVLSRNMNYWDDENTYFDSVTYHFVEVSTELNRYRAGDLDITGNIPPSMFENVTREFGAELRVSPYLGTYYYGFNVSNSVFAGKPGLRRALSLAIDREILVDKITGRGEKPAYSWVPSGVYNYDSQLMPEADLTQKEREELARKLYRESGYSDGHNLQFELRYNTSDVQRRIALAIQAMWRETLGAEATLVNEEFKVLLSNIRERKVTEVFRLSWTGDYNDAQTFLQLFESDNPSNLTGYVSPEFDQLMARAKRQSDDTRRRILMQQAESIVIVDHVVIPLYFYVSKHLVNPHIAGWSNNILDIHPSRHLRIRAE